MSVLSSIQLSPFLDIELEYYQQSYHSKSVIVLQRRRLIPGRSVVFVSMHACPLYLTVFIRTI